MVAEFIPEENRSAAIDIMVVADKDGNERTMNTRDYVVEDSGERESFDSGMVRDTADDKLDHNIIQYGPMRMRWIIHLDTARAKYPDIGLGIPNWTLADSIEEFNRFLVSAGRHFDHWRDARLVELVNWSREGIFQAVQTPEDEAAAVYFNINGAEHVRGKQ